MCVYQYDRVDDCQFDAKNFTKKIWESKIIFIFFLFRRHDPEEGADPAQQAGAGGGEEVQAGRQQDDRHPQVGIEDICAWQSSLVAQW